MGKIASYLNTGGNNMFIEERGTGMFKSGKRSADTIYSAPNFGAPSEYQIAQQLPIYDQGTIGSCVSVSVMEMYWNYLTQKGKQNEFPGNRTYLFNKRGNMDMDGMVPRNAFEILLRENRIKSFARIESLLGIKTSILANGPAMIGLSVKSFNSDFWEGNQNHGGHAVSVVGWDGEGLIIKNSWGKTYGKRGYFTLPYEKYPLIIESWTILS